MKVGCYQFLLFFHIYLAYNKPEEIYTINLTTPCLGKYDGFWVGSQPVFLSLLTVKLHDVWNFFWRHVTQFRDPANDEFSIWVIPQGLGDQIEVTIFSWIVTNPSDIVPVTPVAVNIIVN